MCRHDKCGMKYETEREKRKKRKGKREKGLIWGALGKPIIMHYPNLHNIVRTYTVGINAFKR